MGRKVWATKSRKVRFHKDSGCSAAQRRRGTELIEQDLDDLRSPVPCRVCWPQAPRPRVYHRLCEECGHSKPVPCQHNGGVLIRMTRTGVYTGKFGSSDYDPDQVVHRVRWVWPENAHHYTLVNL